MTWFLESTKYRLFTRLWILAISIVCIMLIIKGSPQSIVCGLFCGAKTSSTKAVHCCENEELYRNFSKRKLWKKFKQKIKQHKQKNIILINFIFKFFFVFYGVFMFFVPQAIRVAVFYKPSNWENRREYLWFAIWNEVDIIIRIFYFVLEYFILYSPGLRLRTFLSSNSTDH